LQNGSLREVRGMLVEVWRDWYNAVGNTRVRREYQDPFSRPSKRSGSIRAKFLVAANPGKKCDVIGYEISIRDLLENPICRIVKMRQRWRVRLYSIPQLRMRRIFKVGPLYQIHPWQWQSPGTDGEWTPNYSWRSGRCVKRLAFHRWTAAVQFRYFPLVRECRPPSDSLVETSWKTGSWSRVFSPVLSGSYAEFLLADVQLVRCCSRRSIMWGTIPPIGKSTRDTSTGRETTSQQKKLLECCPRCNGNNYYSTRKFADIGIFAKNSSSCRKCGYFKNMGAHSIKCALFERWIRVLRKEKKKILNRSINKYDL